MNSANDKTFNDYIIKAVALKDIRAALEKMKKQDRNRKLLEAAVYAHDRVTQLATKIGDHKKAAPCFYKFCEFMRDKVSVVSGSALVARGIA
jgi:hypothetical protein